MMRRGASTILLAAAFCAIAISADLPEKWRVWHYSRAIEGVTTLGDEPAELTVPWEIYAHCGASCDDARILNSRGEEVPFVLQERPAHRYAEAHQARLVENSFVSGIYTQVIGDLGEQHGSYDRVKVDTNRPDFIVWADVALSDDTKIWRIVESRAPIARFRSREVDGTQTIPIQGLSSRYKQGDQTKESLHIVFPENNGYRFIRQEIINENDQPLSKVSFSLAAIPRTLLFKQIAGQNYRLIYGNEKAGRPQYDVAHYLDSKTPMPAYRVLSLGPEEVTANYRDPRPFTERHPEILWSALGLAIVLIGLTAIKTLRTPVRPETQN